MSRYIALAGLSIALLSALPALADPKCAGPENWPAAITHTKLKNDGILVNDEVDFSRTSVQQIATTRINKAACQPVFEPGSTSMTAKLIIDTTMTSASKKDIERSDVS